MDLAKLIMLQDIDKKLMDLENHKGDLPEVVQQLENKMVFETNNLKETKTKLVEAEKAKRDNQNETDELYEKLIKYQEQSYHVKTNKEYDAITVEIETIENKISENESKKSELSSQAKSYTNKVAELDKQVNDLKSMLTEKQAELKVKISQTETDEIRLKKEREKIASQINRTLLANYNRIRNGKNGIALSEVNAYTCSECFATIPAQTAVEVRKMERIILCEVCGRILISTKNHKEQPAIVS